MELGIILGSCGATLYGIGRFGPVLDKKVDDKIKSCANRLVEELDTTKQPINPRESNYYEGRKRCRSCGEMNDKKVNYCIMCGAKF